MADQGLPRTVDSDRLVLISEKSVLLRIARDKGEVTVCDG